MTLTACLPIHGIFPCMPESILIVEDEPALQETLAYNLKKEGYTVETVGDGRDRAGNRAQAETRPDRA